MNPLPRLDRLTDSGIYTFQQAVIALIRAENPPMRPFFLSTFSGDPMPPNTYQTQAARTLLDRPGFPIEPQEMSLVLHALELSAETGELADQIKKGVFHQHGLKYGALVELMRRVHFKLENFISPYVALTLDDPKVMLLWNALGLVGEASEVARLVIAWMAGKPDLEKLEKELGDCLWYLAALCTHTGLDLETVMGKNIEKLRQRYPDGYSAEASRTRLEYREASSVEGA